MSRGPTIGRMWVKDPDNATLRARHCHGIVSYDALGDIRQPGARAGRLRLRRYPPETPRGVAATGAGREEGCGGRAFGDAGAAPRAPHCARIITSHQKDEAAPPSAHGDSHRLHCKSVTVAQSPGRGVRGSFPALHSTSLGAWFQHSPCKPLHSGPTW